MQASDPQNTGSTKAGAAGKKSPLWPKLLTTVVLLGIAAVAVSLLPRGYSQDISIIGKGDNVVVLFHDPFTVDSQVNMDLVNEVRDEYEGRVKFVVADKNLPPGKEFTQMHGVDSTAFVFFAPNGERINTHYGNLDANTLRRDINQAFNFQ